MSSPQNLPDYDELERELRALEVPGAAEAHGVIAGMSSASSLNAEAAANMVLADANPTVDDRKAEQFLIDLHAYTEARLAERASEFELLLPGEDGDVAECAAALADFCRGYLLGLVAGGMRNLATLPDDAREVVEDFMKIAEAEAGGTAESEEQALVELTEYVRVGVQLVYEELHHSVQ